MAGWQAGLLVLVQSVLQQLHVVLPANTAANNLLVVGCVSMPELQQASPLLAGRVHGWLASRAASACAECVAAIACGAACKHSCKQFANRSRKHTELVMMGLCLMKYCLTNIQCVWHAELCDAWHGQNAVMPGKQSCNMFCCDGHIGNCL